MNVSLLLYNLSELADVIDDRKLIDGYRDYFRGIPGIQRAALFEKLVSLSPELLAKLKLEYTPRVPKVFASLYIIPEDPINRTFVLYKNDTTVPPSYYTGG